MAREDPVRVALEVIQAERRAVREPVAPSTRTKVIPAVKPMPRVGVKAMPRIPDPASRTFPKGAQHGYSYVSGPSPASWTRTYALEPCSCPSACCGSRRHACPWPWKTFDRLFPVPGQGTPCSHDATDHLECAFPAAPAYARASAQVVVFPHHSRPTSPRSSQALICPRLSDQKAREHLSLPFLSGSWDFLQFHAPAFDLLDPISLHFPTHVNPLRWRSHVPASALRSQSSFTRAFPVDHSNCQITMPVSLQCIALASSGLHVCPPQSVPAKIFPTQMDAASNLHPPISACRFDILVQLSRKLRPIRRPIVPSSVRVS